MLTIPLYIILFLYLAFLSIFFIFSLINFYHIVMSASFTLASFFMSFFVFAMTILTIYFTAQLLTGVNWQIPIIVLDLDWLSRVFGIHNSF